MTINKEEASGLFLKKAKLRSPWSKKCGGIQT